MIEKINYQRFILVRCCFVSPFSRTQIYATNKLDSAASFQEASPVDYPLGPEKIIHIPGIIR